MRGEKDKSRKTWRRPYRKSRRFDPTCRNHGSCSWCRRNRLHSTKRRTPLKEEE